MQKNEEIKIEDQIMGVIKQKKIRMRPRYFFVIGSVLITLSTAMMAILGIFGLNLIIFSIRRGGNIKSVCIEDAISNYPWWAIFVIIFGFIGSWWFYKKSGKGYKHNPSSIAVVLISTIIIGGGLLSFTNFDSVFEQRGPVRHIYKMYNGQSNTKHNSINCNGQSLK